MRRNYIYAKNVSSDSKLLNENDSDHQNSSIVRNNELESDIKILNEKNNNHFPGDKDRQYNGFSLSKSKGQLNLSFWKKKQPKTNKKKPQKINFIKASEEPLLVEIESSNFENQDLEDDSQNFSGNNLVSSNLENKDLKAAIKHLKRKHDDIQEVGQEVRLPNAKYDYHKEPPKNNEFTNWRFRTKTKLQDKDNQVHNSALASDQPLLSENVLSRSENNELISAYKSLNRKGIVVKEASSVVNILSYADNGHDKCTSKSKGLPNWRSRSNNHIRNIGKEFQRDYLAEAIYRAGYNLRYGQLQQIIQNEISEKYLKCLYIISFYTISNYCGKPSPASEEPNKLFTFLNKIIPLTPEDRAKCVSISRRIDPPPYVISLKVIEAKNLIALDANGLSDPYCKIWLKCKENDVKTTKTKKCTLNPEWNEMFQFQSVNLNRDVICFHLWDEDPVGLVQNLRQLSHVKTLQGCFHCCRDCMKGTSPCGRSTVDDFIGKTEIDIKNIYSEGVDQWLSLTDETGNPRQGEIHISIKFVVPKPKDTSDALKRHLLLTKFCLQHGLKLSDVNGLSITSWDHILNTSAQILLFQHSIQGSIDEFEDLVCKFVNVVNLAVQHISFDFGFLYNILRETHEITLYSSDNLSKNNLESIFHQAVESLYTICLHILSNLHSFDLTENDTKRTQFEFVLRCVKLCEEITKKNSNLISTLRTEIETWCNLKSEELINVKSEDRTKELKTFLLFLLEYQKAADKVLLSVFPEMTYTYITYDILDSTLVGTIKSIVCNLAGESEQATNGDKIAKKKAALKLCIILDTTSNYISERAKIPCSELKIGQFLKWFGVDTIQDWFKWKEDIITVKIEQIVTDDDLQSYLTSCGERYELHSKSAIAATDLIKNELFRLWKLVSSRDQPEFNFLFLRSLHNICMKYAEVLLGVIPMRNLNNSFKSGGKRKICAIANNLWSMSVFSSILVKQVGVYIRSDEELPCTKFVLQMICRILCRDLGYLVKPDLKQKMRQVVQSVSGREQEKNIRSFVGYLNRLLKVECGSDMAFEIRLLFINEVWKHVIEMTWQFRDQETDQVSYYESCTTRCLRCLSGCLGKNANVYEGLLVMLKETEKFCYLDREGSLKKFMWNYEYCSLKMDLQRLILLG
ncbi:hypothetical protein JTE90_007123 [Oedothorax gibbosus]|uniref:C2 domain-containing protein n=1 Tax=Oedothorax gibbosus TaxID=931172 RepID=A0AAV6VQN2_9ARAC|nr:hypothetical protein JTE90_007123 [Oedothorax gibbosus]